jgi:hypothetical protein
MAEILEPERQNIRDNWLSKEHQIVRVHVRKLLNLGAHTTQRAESLHPTIKGTLNAQLSLEEACRRIGKELVSVFRSVEEEESRSWKNVPRTLDRQGFQDLIGKITLYALNLLAVEWEASHEPTLVWAGGCTDGYELPARFALPCCHWMVRAMREGFPIPLSLIHPRWWIQGPAFVSGDWVMGYYDTRLQPRPAFVDRYQDRGRQLLLGSAMDAVDFQQTLHKEAAERVADLVLRSTAQIIANERAITEQEQAVPAKLPEPVKETRTPAYLPTRRSTRRRGLIGLEVSEKQAREREKREKASKKEEQAQEQPTRAKKKQRVAAEIVDAQATQDFIICTPRT